MIKKFFKEKLGSIVFFLIVILIVAWGLISVNNARANAVTYNTDYTAPEANVDLEAAGSYRSVAKTDQLELLYNEAKGTIQVRNLESKYLWRSVADDSMYDMSSVNEQWTAYLTSPITVAYKNLEKRDAAARTLYAAKDCTWRETEYKTNGVRVTYGFPTQGLFIAVDYLLEDGELVVRIPASGIREESVYAVTMIEMMPYFGAAGNEKGGYLFYPDGSGAITTFEKAGERPANVKFASYYTYTHKDINFMNVWSRDAYDRYTAAMPVYGIKNGNDAMFAVFTEGESNTGVAVYPSGYVVDLNHIGFEIYTRNVATVSLHSMSADGGASATGATIQRVDRNLIAEDREIRYYFLNGEDANYSGMAQVYRDYLTESGKLKSAGSGDRGEISLALEILMGASKEGMIFEEYIPMTSFGQVQEILERLQNSGITDTQLVLGYWMKDIKNYEYWGPAGKLGGTGGMKDLNGYLKDHPGVNAYLEVDLTYGTSDTKGISEDKDVARDSLDIEVAAENMDGLTFYLLNPETSYERNKKFLSRLGKYDQLGVAYEKLGRYAYPDYNEERTFTKTQTVERLQDMLTEADRESRNIAVRGANNYTYSYVDYLYRLREDSYGLAITDYSVPFVQMVISGLIPYSTDGAGNLAYDLQYQKLKWVEYGAMPYFYLTYESALNLRDTGLEDLFSSTYTDWEDTVIKTYREFKENLSEVQGQQLVEHEFLTDDLVHIRYANGVEVYINYGDAEASAAGVRVPAGDYVVVGGK